MACRANGAGMEDQRADGVLPEAAAAAAAGSTGAVLTTVLFYPVELVKNRLQSSARGDAAFAYRGLTDGLRCVVREEGAGGLFTGIQPVVLRAVTSDFATIFFGDLLIGWRGHGPSALLLRFLGGWASVLLTLPLEVVSTRVTCARPPVSARTAAGQLW